MSAALLVIVGDRAGPRPVIERFGGIDYGFAETHKRRAVSPVASRFVEKRFRDAQIFGCLTYPYVRQCILHAVGIGGPLLSNRAAQKGPETVNVIEM